MNIFDCLISDYNSHSISLVKIVWSLLRIMLDILNSYPTILTMERNKVSSQNYYKSIIIS